MMSQALKHTASLCNGITPLQIGLSPHLTPLDPGSRGTLTSPREHTGQHAAPRQTAISLQVLLERCLFVKMQCIPAGATSLSRLRVHSMCACPHLIHDGLLLSLLCRGSSRLPDKLSLTQLSR